MELCTAQAISNLPHHKLFSSSNPTRLRFKPSLPLSQTSLSRTNPGLHYFASPLLKATVSEGTSSRANQCLGEERDGVITLEDVSSVEKTIYNEALPTELPKDDSSKDEQTQEFDILDKLNIKFDSEDTYSILLYGSGALVALWLLSAVVGAIDSIPVFPKLMEVVGLGYTFWFSSRYLIFKENRDELAAKIEELKQQVLGSIDD